MRTLAPLLGTFGVVLSVLPALAGEGEDMLATLRKGHPRLLFTEEDEARVEKLAEENKLLAELVAENRRSAEWLLDQPTVEYKLRGPRLLTQSRRCLGRVLTLSMAYRLHGEARFAVRAKKEMLAAASFKDWNPSHFLDVAEMTAALALGYDWLYDALGEEDRAAIRRAIVEKGLKPGLKGYREKAWWSRTHNNWNQVCSGGLALGALALADEEPGLAAEIVARAVQSAPRALASYAPDGAWYEGPAYWGYATEYTALLIAGLESALGDDFALAGSPGLDRAGVFRIHGISPAGMYFSYADCGGAARAGPSAAMLWLARRFDRPVYAWYHRSMLERQLEGLRRRREPYVGDRFRALEIAWFDPRGAAPEGAAAFPPDALFRGRADVVTMRGAWGEADALWVGLKGGDNSLSHAHMDIGSFELDADGVRWATELGSDDYNLPGYWQGREGGQRWEYYRLNSLSHNTLVIGGKLQRAGGLCRVVAFSSERERAHAVVDMTAAYQGQASKVLRGLAMLDRSRVLVVDELAAPEGEVRWGMVTPAKIELAGARATLTRDGRTLTAEILEPAGAAFEIVSTDPGDGKQRPNPGTAMLAFRAESRKVLRLAVLLTPAGGKWKKLPPPAVESLSEWAGRLKKR